MSNPYQKYQEQMVTTMTQGEMLRKLFDESLRQIELAKVAIGESNIQQMDAANKKAQKIFLYLKSCLDLRYPVANSLSKLYDFFNQELVNSNIKKIVKPLDDIAPLVLDLRNTFEEVDRMDRANRTASVAAGVV